MKRLKEIAANGSHGIVEHRNLTFGQDALARTFHPKIDRRLRVVSERISAATHADIGSDHGGLLVRLLVSGRIQRGIAIENKQQPFQNSCRALADLNADVRLGDGLEALAKDEVDSLSICGMGAESMVKILEAFPDRLPGRVVLQPNRQPELIRRWALRRCYHLADERIVKGHWPYAILSFHRADRPDDPAYDGVECEAGLLLGPLILKRADPQWEDQLREEELYLSQFDRLGEANVKRLAVIRRALAGVANR